MKSAEIKDLSVKELQERIDVEKAQLSKLKLQHGVSPIENPSIIKIPRKSPLRTSSKRTEKPLYSQSLPLVFVTGLNG